MSEDRGGSRYRSAVLSFETERARSASPDEPRFSGGKSARISISPNLPYNPLKRLIPDGTENPGNPSFSNPLSRPFCAQNGGRPRKPKCPTAEPPLRRRRQIRSLPCNASAPGPRNDGVRHGRELVGQGLRADGLGTRAAAKSEPLSAKGARFEGRPGKPPQTRISFSPWSPMTPPRAPSGWAPTARWRAEGRPSRSNRARSPLACGRDLAARAHEKNVAVDAPVCASRPAAIASAPSFSSEAKTRRSRPRGRRWRRSARRSTCRRRGGATWKLIDRASSPPRPPRSRRPSISPEKPARAGADRRPDPRGQRGEPDREGQVAAHARTQLRGYGLRAQSHAEGLSFALDLRRRSVLRRP